MFSNRHEAGAQLAKKLAKYASTDTVVIALPRGGVVLGSVIAATLDLPLDIITTRKIGHPLYPEYAVGVIDEHGSHILDETETDTIDPHWLQRELVTQKAEARRRSELYRHGQPPYSVHDKTVLLIDDGVATGFTMRLAISAVREQGPVKVIVAVPIAPAEALTVLLASGADGVITLESPESWRGSVGAHYDDFNPVSDDEVISLLKQAPS